MNPNYDYNDDIVEEDLGNAYPTTQTTQTQGGYTDAQSRASVSYNLESPLSPIVVTISPGEKIGEGIGAFMTYRVHTKTTLRTFSKSEFSTVRRYKDFLWLYERLCEEFKTHLIPALPEKSLAITERFSADFIEYRRLELERFICRIVNHKVLQESVYLKPFLEAGNSDFIDAKAKSTSKTNFALSMASAFGMKIASTIAPAIELDPWFTEKKNFINSLETQLNALANAVQQIVTRNAEISELYGFLSKYSESLSEMKSSNASDNLKTVYSRLSFTTKEISPLNNELAKGIKMKFEDDVRDHIRMLGSMKNLMNYRLERLASYQDATANWKGKSDNYQKIRQSGGKMPNNLESEVAKLKQIMDSERAQFEAVSASAREEILQFEATKAKEIQQAILALVKINIDHGLLVSDMWKNLLTGLSAN